MTDISEWMEAKAKKNKSAEGEEDTEIGRNALLDGALRLAARGWEVFPCKPDGSKAPLVPGGFKSATTDAACIRGWWTTWPGAWVAVATGERSGIVCLDVDEKPERGKFGGDTLEAMEEIHGGIPDTVEAMTAGGGRHLLFNHPGGGRRIKSTVEALGNGLDTRADGGYIIVCPSPGYEWEASNPKVMADCPQWILDVVETSGQVVGLYPSDRALEAVPIEGDELARVSAALAVLVTASSVVKKYDPWLFIGMALHEGSGGSQQGFELWDQWSMQIDGYVTDVSGKNSTQRKWASFGRRDTSIGMGTLFDMARENGYLDDVQVEREEVRSAQEEKWKKDQEPRPAPEIEPTVDDGWRCAPLPVVQLEAVARLLMRHGCDRVVATVGAITIGSLLASRRWDSEGCDGLNMAHGLVSHDGRAGRKVLMLVEQLISAAGLSAMIHQGHIDSAVGARRMLYETPVVLYAADDFAGLNDGSGLAISKKMRDGFNEMMSYAWDGRALQLRASELANVGVFWSDEHKKDGATVIDPAVVLLASIGERQLPMVYSKEALDAGSVGRFVMAISNGVGHGIRKMAIIDDDEEIQAVLGYIAAFVGDPGDKERVFCGGPGYRTKAGEVTTEVAPWMVEDLGAITEAAEVQNSTWAAGLEADAVDAMRRLTGVLGAWSGGVAGRDLNQWAATWVGHWYSETLTTIKSVGGAKGGQLSVSEYAYQCIKRYGDKGAWLSENMLIDRCKPLQALGDRERQDAIIQGLIKCGRVKFMKPPGRGTVGRLYIVESMA